MMNRDEFNKTVRAMKAEGVSLSMPNLMVRTELPRATIEDWLAEIDQPAPKGVAGNGTARAEKRRVADPSDDVAGALLDRMSDLKKDLARTAATALVKDKLGIDDAAVERTRDAPLEGRKLKDIRWGAGLGFFLGPLGLFYSAPLSVAGLASAIYIVGVVLCLIPLLGHIVGVVLGPLIGIAHVTAAVAGAAYTWRYNRAGRRSALLPDGTASGRRRRNDDEP